MSSQEQNSILFGTLLSLVTGLIRSGKLPEKFAFLANPFAAIIYAVILHSNGISWQESSLNALIMLGTSHIAYKSLGKPFYESFMEKPAEEKKEEVKEEVKKVS